MYLCFASNIAVFFLLNNVDEYEVRYRSEWFGDVLPIQLNLDVTKSVKLVIHFITLKFVVKISVNHL